MATIIRPMQATDLPAVFAIERRCHGFSWSEEIFRHELTTTHSRILLLEKDGIIAGFLCWWQIAGEIEIQNIATDPLYRRQGVASQLLQEVLNDAEKSRISRVLLEVRAGNSGAIALYHAYGFRDGAIRRCYYADGEDALLMGKNFIPSPIQEIP